MALKPVTIHNFKNCSFSLLCVFSAPFIVIISCRLKSTQEELLAEKALNENMKKSLEEKSAEVRYLL